MAYVSVPKDLTNIKTKFIGNFTKRQCICFGLGVLVGFPIYFFSKKLLGNTGAFYLLIVCMCPFFLFGIFEKDGLPLEKILKNYIKHKFVFPQVRYFVSENIYEYVEEKIKEGGNIQNDNRNKKGSKKKYPKKGCSNSGTTKL